MIVTNYIYYEVVLAATVFPLGLAQSFNLVLLYHPPLS